MVGDREHDVIGAREAGIDCLGVLYGFGTREELEKAGAVYIAESVEDILHPEELRAADQECVAPGLSPHESV